jgi:sugar lactone lactonase YvrE
MTGIEALDDERDELGESPQWLAELGVLQRVDIRGRTIHRTATGSGDRWRRALQDDTGFALPTASGGIVAGVGRTLLRLRRPDADPERIAEVEAGARGNRFNDAKADPAGRLWAGTMSTRREPGVAALYRVDPAGAVEPALTGVTLSNGLDWSLDATRMYYVDSTTQQIDAIAFDVDRGRLGSRRRFAAIAAADGLPDGLAVDAEGGVWIALFGGARLRRYAPSGRLDAELALPVSCPTSMAFGGPALDTLYVTTSRHLLSAAQRRAEPLAGAVLVLRPGVAGRPQWRAAL